MGGIPEVVLVIAQRCRSHGGRAFLVGGGVRDELLGRPVTDWDVEVYGIPERELETLLRELGQVSAVGRSFGVLKLLRGSLEVDVSLPRRDSKAGAGHRGIHVEGDPCLSLEEATRRRDLTINAILRDPLTGEILDPHEGRRDLLERRLRAVDAGTFLEDPLRALRVVQLAARLDFTPDEELLRLCAGAALDELPAERIQGEWTKLLLKGARPSKGLDFARRTGILGRVFPEAAAGDDPSVDAALDRFAMAPPGALKPEGRRLAVGLAVWLHRSTALAAEATLDRLWLHRWKGYQLRERVLRAVEHWRAVPKDDASLRHLSTRTEIFATAFVCAFVTDAPEPLQWLERARALGIAEAPPEPILKGRHLKELGIAPGPAIGKVLRHVYALQLDGAITSFAEALDAARKRLTADGYIPQKQ